MHKPTKRFQHRFPVSAPPETVAAYHHSPEVLKRLTPPPVIVQFHAVEPLAEGSRAEFTLWLGPLPVRWLAVHRDVDALTGFTDEQAQGPFRSWIHTHRFIPDGHNGTLVEDHIQAEIDGKGPLAWLVSWGMWLSLPLLFAYRAWRTRRDLARLKES